MLFHCHIAIVRKSVVRAVQPHIAIDNLQIGSYLGLQTTVWNVMSCRVERSTPHVDGL